MLLVQAFAVTSCLKVPSDDCDKLAPDAITDPVSFISSEGAILNGRFSAQGQTTGVTFEFGAIGQYGQSVEPLSVPVSQISFSDLGWKGVCWTLSQSSVSMAKYREIDQAGVISETTSKPGKYLLNNKNFGFSVR